MSVQVSDDGIRHGAQPGAFCSAPCLAGNRHPECGHSAHICLIQAAAQGHSTAQELLFSRLYPPVRSHARRLCFERLDAEDLAQVSLLAVFQKIGQLRDRSRLLGWIREVVRTTHLMSLRRSVFAPPRVHDLCATDEEPASPAPSADDWIAAREAFALAVSRTRHLTPPLRDVIELRVFQEQDTAQTARALRISTAAVRTRLKRAREALRDSLPCPIRS